MAAGMAAMAAGMAVMVEGMPVEVEAMAEQVEQDKLKSIRKLSRSDGFSRSKSDGSRYYSISRRDIWLLLANEQYSCPGCNLASLPLGVNRKTNRLVD
jgi:hypothetical protein